MFSKVFPEILCYVLKEQIMVLAHKIHIFVRNFQTNNKESDRETNNFVQHELKQTLLAHTGDETVLPI